MQDRAIVDGRRARSLATRHKIIQAAIECYKRLGVEKTFMDDVAKEAEIGRATLYRHFVNQDEILTEVVLCELEGIKKKLSGELVKQKHITDYIIAGCVLVLMECPKLTITPLLFKEGAASIISRISLSNDLLIELGVELVTPFYNQAKQMGIVRRGVKVEHMVEWITRILISLLTTPSPEMQSKAKIRKYLKNFLLPSLVVER